MKKALFILTMILLPAFLKGQTYSNLWKQVKDAEQQDLPQTEQKLLRQIAQKASVERNYGHLLKAQLQEARAMTSISRDSLLTAVGQLQQQEQQAAGNEVLQAVYDAALGFIFQNTNIDTDDLVLDGLDRIKDASERRQFVARHYYDKALSHPDKLAAVKATDYEPFVVEGADSRLFGDDLLSVIGYEAGRFDVLRDYYVKAGNRRAALLSTLEVLRREAPEGQEPLNKSQHLQRLDSLIAAYADLTECGEAAIARYEFMDGHTDATDEQRWQYINYALDRWGGWQRMNILRNSQHDLTALTFNAEFDKLNIPERQQEVKLRTLRGINSLTMRIYSVKAEGDTYLNPSSTEGYRKLKPLLTPLPHLTQTRTFVGHQAYETFNDSMTIGALPPGVYLVEFESAPQTDVSRRLYYVSDVRVMVQPLPGRQQRYIVVNATTGQPLKGASVRLSKRVNYNERRTLTVLTTDAEGEATYRDADHNVSEVFAYTTADAACPILDNRGDYHYNGPRELISHVEIYTDRQIYRPGQTVRVAAICYLTRHGYQNEVEGGKRVNLVLRDANQQVIAEKELVTDDYGTCTADFTLPVQTLNGHFTVSCDGHSSSFRVEEYKRPAFEVTIPAVSRTYDDGDTLVVRGTARTYAGVPVQGAHVKYKVERRKAFWWFSYSRYWDSGMLGSGSDDELLFSGEATTDADGSFAMDVPIIVPKTLYTMFYNFVVTADVTDQGGETHQGILSLPMGNRRTAFTSTIPERVLAEEDTKMSFHQQNAAGVDLEATVRYRFDDGKWQEVKTNTLFTLPSLKSGRHTLEAICEQDSLEEKFIVFSLDDRQPAFETDDWFYASNTQFPNNRQPVTVQVGSSAKDVHIVYSIFAGDNIVESGYVDRTNELLNRKFAYQESYGDGILLTFAWVKEGKTYQHQTTIRRPLPDKHLKLTWHTFRNRLTPGQKEEWTLTVTPPATTEPASGSTANPVAQLMATLYDKSLDQLSAHSWGLYPYVYLPLPSTRWIIVSEGLAYCSGYKHQGVLNVNGLALNTFDHSVYPSSYLGRFDLIGGGGGIRLRGTRMMKAASNMAFAEAVEEESAVLREVVPTGYAVQSKAVADEASDDLADEAAPSEEGHEQQVQVRENLQETAFFYPQLTTDNDGNVALRFTLPESLTTWRFMTIAHTKDMMYGSFADEAVARKDVMIQPNMPRFLRQGDRATIAARIINTSEKNLSGNAHLLLIDPETDKTVAQSTLPVTLTADSTVSVSFACQPQEHWPSLLIAKVTVSGTDFSDGEQHYLPILANQEQVTVTVPFTQHGPGTKEVHLETILPKAQASNSKPLITVEYTNNPAWLMVQALPAIGHPNDNCAICQAASLYANTIGSHIIAQNPQAKTVFEQWKQEALKAAAEHAPFSTLNSQLEKNQELKDLLLNETPWVVDANNEHEQRQRLADFFDENLMQQRLSAAVSQLENLQLSDGAWSWWPGMPGSWYITVEVSEMLVRLSQMTGTQYPKLLDPAIKYIGKEIVKLVDEMKKEDKLGHKQSFPSFKCLQWLYICTLDGRELPANVRDANAYLTALLKKETKSQTIYEKALSAIVLNNQTYIKSLKEFTVYKEEMGRYYDTQRASYSWRDYRIPTQVAAIEAIKRLTPNDTTTIEQMQRWLLQEKRTQAWDKPINSADAVYAFLNGNTETLKAQPKSVLSIDGKELDTPTATAGIGYVKTTLPLAATGKAAPKVFTAEKTSTGTSWGAIYAQFMQNTTDITDQASGLTVKREVFLSAQNTQNNPSTLKVGDRVTVRLTITADRDYDFVQVIDKRAACLEPVNQLSGYHWGYYCSPKDYTTNFYFDRMSKGKHVIENEYYVDREGTYTTGTCTVGCAYAPEYRGMTHAQTFSVVAND